MPRSTEILTVRQVATVDTPGRYEDGGGLYLEIAAGGTRSWLLEIVQAGIKVQLELGNASTVSLTTARRQAFDLRYAIASGQDPLSALKPTVPELGTIPTFGSFARRHIDTVENGRNTPEYHQRWLKAFHKHAEPLLGKPIDEIGTDDVIAVLEPIWLRLPHTAQRLRQRIEKILDAAAAGGFRPGSVTNPALWRGNLLHLLPATSRSERRPHPTLPWNAAPKFFAELRAREAVTARCLELLVLTATRSGGVLGLTWGEVDWNSRLLRFAGSRTSSNEEHVVPLSRVAADLLLELRPEVWRPNMHVFSVNGKTLSSKAISMLLRRMSTTDVTAFGFRATFKEWAQETTDYPPDLIEHALGHAAMSPKSDGGGLTIREHREMMEAWSAFLVSGRDPALPSFRSMAS